MIQFYWRSSYFEITNANQNSSIDKTKGIFLMKQPMQAPGLWERGYNQKQTKKNNLFTLFTVPYSSPAP